MKYVTMSIKNDFVNMLRVYNVSHLFQELLPD